MANDAGSTAPRLFAGAGGAKYCHPGGDRSLQCRDPGSSRLSALIAASRSSEAAWVFARPDEMGREHRPEAEHRRDDILAGGNGVGIAESPDRKGYRTNAAAVSPLCKAGST